MKLFYAAEEAELADDATLAAAASDSNSNSDYADTSSLDALLSALEAVLDDDTLDGQFKVCDTHAKRLEQLAGLCNLATSA